MLPCSETICEKHINEIKHAKLGILECKSCNEDHQIPISGFPIDKRMVKLLSRNFQQMNFGEIHLNAFDYCKDFNAVIDKLKHLTHDPSNFIHNYFEKVKNKIDLRREKTISRIREYHRYLIEEIQKYKEECLSQMKKDFSPQLEILEEAKKNLDLWQNKLEIPVLNIPEFSFEKINKNVTSGINILNDTINKLEDELLLNND